MRKFRFIVEVASGLDDNSEVIRDDINEALKVYGLQGRVLGIVALREEGEEG